MGFNFTVFLFKVQWPFSPFRSASQETCTSPKVPKNTMSLLFKGLGSFGF